MSVDLNPDGGGRGAAADESELLRQELGELQDRFLRSAAEFDNFRKRTERERRELSDAVAADLIRDILPVLDDLERAIAAAADSPDAALKAGVELIHRQLHEALKRRGAEPLTTVGEDFDPAWHEAMGSEPAAGRRDGEIVAEIRKGYRIGQRLIRPAMVKVAKA